jgi:hypothetical protein
VNWKTTALRARIATTGRTWIWAEDEEIAMARTSPGFDDDPIFTVPHVMFEPVPTVGLTLDDVAAIEIHADRKMKNSGSAATKYPSSQFVAQVT